MAKVHEIRCPKVGKYVRVQVGRGPQAGSIKTGKVTWSQDGAWTLDTGLHIFRSDQDDKLVWISSTPWRGKSDDVAPVALPEHARVRRERNSARKQRNGWFWLWLVQTLVTIALLSLMGG